MLQPTYLKYLEYGSLLQDNATIQKIGTSDDDKTYIILDQTIFYPQGGGQPFDQGTIKNETRTFNVQEVRFKDGIVYHYGTFENEPCTVGQKVDLNIDESRRLLNSRNHSAGHLIDLSLNNLGQLMKPTKGYHFPQGAYVEYAEILDNDTRQQLIKPLETELNNIVQAALPIEIRMVNKNELEKISSFIPDNLPINKPTRVMIVQGYSAIPCGGTHVANTKDIGRITIDKIKNKKGNLRISYSIDS